MLVSEVEGQNEIEEETVSIILPVFNDQETITQSLTSLMNQSYKKLEIIVVNDGSSDQTRLIAREVSKNDPRVRIVNIEHSGTSIAKNTGFQLSKGLVVFFAEGDAIYESDYVSKSVECLQSDPKIGGVCVLGGIWEVRRTFVTKSIESENQIKHALMHAGKMEPFYAWVFTREALKKAGVYDTKLRQAEDRDLFARVKQSGYMIGLVEGAHWKHRRYETAWQFFVKNFRKGRNRMLFVVKNNRSMEFIKGIGGLWLPIGLALFSFLAPIFAWIALLSVIVFTCYFYFRVIQVERMAQLSLGQLLSLPLYQMLRYFSNSLGYTAGIFSYIIRSEGNV